MCKTLMGWGGTVTFWWKWVLVAQAMVLAMGCGQGEIVGPHVGDDAAECEALTCEASGKNCGTISDGCGALTECGSCQKPESCGGGGVPNVCGIPDDTVPPAIEITAPADGESFSVPLVTVSGTASDEGGLSKVEVKVGAGGYEPATGTTSWSKEVTLAPGPNAISARAVDNSGNATETSVTVTCSATEPTPPAAPLSFSAFAGDAQITLTWTAPADGGAPITNYRLFRGGVSGQDAFLIELGNVSSHVDTGLTNGVTYYYKISAKNSVGEGPQSDEAKATPAAGNGRLIFDGSFKATDKYTSRNGAFGAFTRGCIVAADRAVVHPAPRRPGKYMLTFTIKDGDACNTSTGAERVAIEKTFMTLQPKQAAELWIGWSNLVDPSWKPNGTWGNIPGSGLNSLNFAPESLKNPAVMNTSISAGMTGATTNRIQARVMQEFKTIIEAKDFKLGVWNDFMFHVRYARDNSGFLYIYHREEGQSEYNEVYKKLNFQTMVDYQKLGYPNDPLYVRTTIYRGAPATITQIASVMDLKVGTTRADVEYKP